ncbi:MAG: NAD(P)H-hydrate epimerase, partial [Rhodobacteraceae bacterium]|nr:NAD(P)H-hydrate epimerase [Paracoccaceae bacterium]
MTELLTAAQMRAIEQAAIASGQVTGLELMERAGQGVVEAILAEWPALATTAQRAVVLCGPGNNGGDGFVVARLLKERGWEVEVFLYGDPGKMPPDARVNYERWVGMGEISPVSKIPEVRDQNVELWVDALFGIGCTRPLDSEAQLLLKATFQNWPLVAIDILSGIDADSGRWIGGSPAEEVPDSCALTVTFHRAKVGHVLGEGSSVSSRLRIVDLGLPTLNRGRVSVLKDAQGKRQVLNCVSLAERLAPTRFRKLDGHKYSHGHALILSGPFGRGGAARLAGRGALRIGAGVVTLGCPPDAIPENAARLDAVMLREVAD